MFDAAELSLIVSSLGMAIKSATRLANRADQPVSVANEYRSVIGTLSALQRKALSEVDKVAKVKK